MDRLLPATDSPTNASEYSVSEISGALKRAVEDQFGNVRVHGEVSGYRGPHSSGHCYFALKDDRARLEAVIWKGTFGRLKFRPEEGMEVIASGKLTTYPGSSKYQIVIDNLEPAGAGALMAMLEERRRRLAAEGLFDEARKQLLPFMPRVIGVVTSPTGAVIRDIIHRVSARFPVHVVVWPVRVQGETTGAEVAAAVAGFNALDPAGAIPRPDVLIVARGGGSLEDLWGFNDEAVVRAVAASHIPVISAVGHETDWTLIDHAADMRAPTPTGAAELAVPVRADLEAAVASLSARLGNSVGRLADRRRDRLRAVARALPSADQLLALPRRRFDEAAARLGRALLSSTQAKRQRFRGVRLTPATLDRRIGEARRRIERDGERLPGLLRGLVSKARERFSARALRIAPTAPTRRIETGRRTLATLERRGDQAMKSALARQTARWAQSARMIRSLSYKAVLERGFALVRDADGTPVREASSVRTGQDLRIEFADGTASAIGTGRDAPRPRGRPADRGGGQGSLF